ncbi:MAG TPA: glycosyltransferase family 87 protein [Caulobacteraceae bacterium]|jgi:hypothetical protein
MSLQLGWVARADWLDEDRARAWRNVLLVLSGIALLAWWGPSRHGLDLVGRPIGTDFLSFYAASELVLSGHAAAAYSIPAHRAAETAVFGHTVGYPAFFYPPLFLLICAPLAKLPYLGALFAWLGVTGAAYIATAREWVSKRSGLLAALAFPAVFANIGHGQNAFLSAALLGAGARWLDRRPVLAGVALGLLAYKPHLGLLLPVVLIIARRWTTIFSAAATVAAFACLSLLAFGVDAWTGFLDNSHLARVVLETGVVGPDKMVSAFAAVRVLGGPAPLAYAAQAAVAVFVIVSLVRTRRMWVRHPSEPALLVMAALLGSPFLLDYDLVILALPLAWLATTGAREGFRPWEKLGLTAGFVLPLVARSLAHVAGLPIAPLVLLALFNFVLRRSDARASDVLIAARLQPQF